jgi:acetylornithine deacetylase/succinyl-diaminopimelate desuccinylase-like protein
MAEQAPEAPDARAVELCARLIRFDTTNRGGGDCNGEREAAEFVAGELAASGLDPELVEPAPRRANVVARVAGTDPRLPALLVHGHLDVVPADAAHWSVPPFAGEVRDGYLWGRGAVDMKDTCAAVLSVLRSWAARGVAPRRDLVLAFVADEEDNGEHGADWLVAKRPELFDGCAAAIGEGGGFSFGQGPVPLYPIGTAERGTLHVRLVATGRAGHGSRPNPDNAVVALVQTLARIAAHRWPVRLTPAVSAYLTGAAAALGVPVDPAALADSATLAGPAAPVAQADLAGPAVHAGVADPSAVDGLVARLGRAGTLAAGTVRATATPTVLRAGHKVNVVPSEASALVDIRTLPGDAASVLATVDAMLAPGVRREVIASRDAVAAPPDSPWFAAMAAALVAEDPAAVVLPYCLGGGTDAKAFASLGMACYGFAPVRVPLDPAVYDYRAMAHGVDERVPIDGLRFGARVLDRFLRTV